MDAYQSQIRELYQKYHRGLYGYIYSSNRNDDLARDILQDTFINFIKIFKGKTLPSEPQCRAYLYRTARNRMINFSRSYDQRNVVRDDRTEVLSDRPGPEQQVIQESEAAIKLKVFQTALEQMKESERTILILRYEDELTVQEIADIMELSFSRTYRLLKKAEQNIVASAGKNLKSTFT